MKTIELKRGGKTVSFEKVPDRFAVRLKRGKASDSADLDAIASKELETRHVESARTENLEVFAVREADELEETMEDLREAPDTDVVTHMYSIDDTAGGTVIPTGTMTLQFETDVGPTEREEILEEFGLEIVEELDFLSNGYTVRLTEAATENPLKIAAKLQNRDELKTAEPDLSFQITPYYTPADTLYPRQWHLHNRGDDIGLKRGADVKAEEAWEYTRGSRDIVVCVTDDGFDLGHPDFAAPDKIVSPRDFYDEDFEPLPEEESDNHGTACAGVAVAEENGSGVVGLAPGCSFMPVRTSGWLSDTSMVDLFQYAIDHHADVISCSWGAAAAYFPLSTAMHGIIRKAATQGRRNGKGCVVLFAAGNGNHPLDGTKDGRVHHEGFALHPDVIAVGASNSQDERSWYSNYGPELTLCAPSNGRPGQPIVTADRRGGPGYSPDDYAYDFGGTSSATPLAAGLAGLLLSLEPELSSAEVKRIMTDTADKIDEENGEYVDGHSPWYGRGRINAQRAVALLAGDREETLPYVLSLNHRINRPIPDAEAVKDAIEFPLDIRPEGLEVSVKIRHPRQSDLRVTLLPPEGDEITLVDRIGGRGRTVNRRFRSSDSPEKFGEALERSARGRWSLRVADTAEENAGTLVNWGLAVTYDSTETER